MNGEVRQCPRCAAEIPIEATVCPSCAARFAVVEQGYCLRCHQVVETDSRGHCPTCGGEVIDRRAVSALRDEAAPAAPPARATAPAGPPPAAPRPRAGPAPSATVTLRLQTSYNMPPICVACARPAGSATMGASGASYSGRQRLNLYFPLCEECARAHRLGRRYQVLAGLIGVLAGLLLALPVLLRVPGVPPYFLGIAVALAVVVAVGLGTLAWRRESPAVRQAYGWVNRAVTLVFIMGGVVVTFANRDFARQFQALNTAAVLDRG
jgi:RNA polymerase subunit RPABC4/transcription elongation factor Spt4